MTAVKHSAGSPSPSGTIGISRDTDFTLASGLDRDLFVATSPLTVTVPTGLGNGFRCDVVNDSGGSVVIDGPGVTNVTISDGHMATIYESNYKQRVTTNTSTIVGDRFAEDTPWDPTVFGFNFDLAWWWDASSGIQLDVDSGLVRHWFDQITGFDAKETGLIHQPAWPNSDEVRFDGIQKGLTTNPFSRAGWESKWWLLLFRVNWTAMNVVGARDSAFVSINGGSASGGQRQPDLRPIALTHQITTNWYSNSGNVALTLDVPGADDTWHSLICRRDDNGIYASIDGAAESFLACYPRGFVPTASFLPGTMGARLGTVHQVQSFGIDTLLGGQRAISAHEVAAMHAWALWKRGAQASLDASSPYLVDPPLMGLADQHVETADSWALDGYNFGASGTLDGWDDTVRGNALSLAGFTRSFHDHFTDINTVTDGLTGSGTQWFAPAHIDTSPAKFRRPSQTSPVTGLADTFTLLPDNTTLQIKLQAFNAFTTDWTKQLTSSGHMQTIDVWRNGWSQAVPPGGASYFEASIALNAKGVSFEDGSVVEPAPAWNAFWLYTTLDAQDAAATKAEIDVMETYGDRVPSIYEAHFNAHRHSAYRPQPGNAGSPGNAPNHKTPSLILDMTQSPFNVSPSLFDGQGDGQPGTFHRYGVKVDETWITWYFDGLAVGRYATYREALGPLFMIVSLQSLRLDPLGVPGHGGGTIDCETYMWVDYVDAWVKS